MIHGELSDSFQYKDEPLHLINAKPRMLYLDNDVYQLAFYVSTPGKNLDSSNTAPKLGLPVAFPEVERLYYKV
jgi:hypothetical protein